MIGLVYQEASRLALKRAGWQAGLVYELARSLRESVELVGVLDRAAARERDYDWLLAGPRPEPRLERNRYGELFYKIGCHWCGGEFDSKRPHTRFHPTSQHGCRTMAQRHRKEAARMLDVDGVIHSKIERDTKLVAAAKGLARDITNRAAAALEVVDSDLVEALVQRSVNNPGSK